MECAFANIMWCVPALGHIFHFTWIEKHDHGWSVSTITALSLSPEAPSHLWETFRVYTCATASREWMVKVAFVCWNITSDYPQKCQAVGELIWWRLCFDFLIAKCPFDLETETTVSGQGFKEHGCHGFRGWLMSQNPFVQSHPRRIEILL